MPAFTCWLDWLYSQWVAICLGLQSGPIEFIARKKFIKTVQQEKSLVQQGNLCAHFCCSTPPFRDLGFYPCGETTGRYSPNLMEFPKDLGWASLPLALSVSHLGNGKSKAWDRGLDQWLGCSLLLSQWKAMAFGQWPEWQSSMSKLWRNECNVWWATAYSCFTDLSTEMQQWYNGTMEFQKTFSLTSVPLLLLLYLLMSWIFLRGVLTISCPDGLSLKDGCRKSYLGPGQDSRAQRQGPALLGIRNFSVLHWTWFSWASEIQRHPTTAIPFTELPGTSSPGASSSISSSAQHSVNLLPQNSV